MHPSEASRGERKSISSGIWKGGSETLCCGLIESAKQHGRSSHHLFPSAFQLDRTPRGFCDSGGGLEPHSAVGAEVAKENPVTQTRVQGERVCVCVSEYADPRGSSLHSRCRRRLIAALHTLRRSVCAATLLRIALAGKPCGQGLRYNDAHGGIDLNPLRSRDW